MKGTVAIKDLSVTFDTPNGAVKAVSSVTMTVGAGKRAALLGESGCGKSVLALAMFNLLPRNAVVEGAITVDNVTVSDPGMAQSVRGTVLSICWSNAERFFNPVMTVGDQVVEAYAINHPGNRAGGRDKAFSLLENLGFDDPRQVFTSYPFQLSGGMNQRAMIAMSMINDPPVLVVDEPTRGLDDLNRKLVMEAVDSLDNVTLLLITHDVDCAIRISETASIMKEGAIIDSGLTGDILVMPSHPYTARLVESCPHHWNDRTRPLIATENTKHVPDGDPYDAT